MYAKALELGCEVHQLGIVPDRQELISKATWADIGKAKSLLGWEPKVSLEEGIKRTVEWTLDNWSWIKDVRL